MKPYIQSWLRRALCSLTLLVGGIWLAVAGAYQYLAPNLPDVAALSDVRLQVPLRIYSRDGRLIAQIGEQKRIPLRYEEFPPLLINALLAAEDDQFFSHSGVDYPGQLRSIIKNLVSVDRGQGGSTITMQLTKEVFFTRDKVFRRKLLEIFTSLQIERMFSKQEILSLYLNMMFLGQRAYGVGAAAEVYFGKTIDQLTLPEIAIVVGTFRSPSKGNPIASPDSARKRRHYVLRRMHEKKFISAEDYSVADNAPVLSKLHGAASEVEAPYLAEMVRADMLARYGNRAYTDGFRVITSIDSRHQQAAVSGVRMGLIEYDRRHGYRGPIARLKISLSAADDDYRAALNDYPAPGGLELAAVLVVANNSVEAFTREHGRIAIPFANLRWAKPALADGAVGKAPEQASDVLAAGDVIYVAQDIEGAWHLVQAPEAQAAFVALDPQDGAITALVGGYDYYVSNFNRAVQAKRQPGSSLKPFLYSAALENGFTPATVVNDAPAVYNDPSLETVWRPKNSSDDFLGPVRMREALYRSRNAVSIRIIDKITPAVATEHMLHFGFTPEELPKNLSLALGATEISPLSMARAYAVFANGGFRVTPYWIDRIEDADGKIIFVENPKLPCPNCAARIMPRESDTDANAASSHSTTNSEPRSTDQVAPVAISPQNAYIMTDMMMDVIRRGTGQRALALKRSDIAGKTGTTNDGRDTWFCGFNADIVGVAWVGFDQGSLGVGEGGKTALPIWIKFMAEALQGQPEHRLPEPLGLSHIRVSAVTGKRASANDANAIQETFFADHLPATGEQDESTSEDSAGGEKSDESIF